MKSLMPPINLAAKSSPYRFFQRAAVRPDSNAFTASSSPPEMLRLEECGEAGKRETQNIEQNQEMA
jgi:hypothetical protein